MASSQTILWSLYHLIPKQMHMPPLCASKDLYNGWHWCRTAFVKMAEVTPRVLRKVSQRLGIRW